MPQMSPIMWMSLYIMFTVTLIAFITMFFFFKAPTTKPLTPQSSTTQKLNWKW